MPWVVSIASAELHGLRTSDIFCCVHRGANCFTLIRKYFSIQRATETEGIAGRLDVASAALFAGEGFRKVEQKT